VLLEWEPMKDHAPLLDVARSLEPLIRRHEDELERARRLPEELVDALHDCGVFRAFVPRELGGLEVDLLEWLDMIEELSRINGSVGWNASINAGVTPLPAATMTRGLPGGPRIGVSSTVVMPPHPRPVTG
jgi:indole-3-acetate monooxygenase